MIGCSSNESTPKWCQHSSFNLLVVCNFKLEFFFLISTSSPYFTHSDGRSIPQILHPILNFEIISVTVTIFAKTNFLAPEAIANQHKIHFSNTACTWRIAKNCGSSWLVYIDSMLIYVMLCQNRWKRHCRIQIRA